MRTDRAVSTVLDVALALVIVGASVLLLGSALQGTGDAPDPARVDRTAESLAESTIDVQYASAGDGGLERTDYGSPVDLLATAAVLNASLEGTPLRPAASEYEAAVDASTRSALVGSNADFHVVAEWEAYTDAAIGGTATAGERPPAAADVSSLTLTASSGIEPVDEGELERAVRDGDDPFVAAGAAIGAPIVDAFLPPDRTQLALESQGTSRDRVVADYERTVAPLEYAFDGTANPERGGPLSRTEADALEANRLVLQGSGNASSLGEDGLAGWIGDDLRRVLSPVDEGNGESSEDGDPEEIAADSLAGSASTETVTITVRTWEP